MKLDLWNILYIAIYVATGSTQSLLIKMSFKKGFKYEAVAVTLTVEFSKLIIGGIIYFFLINRDIPVKTKLISLSRKWDQARLFSVPAALYCIYNALNFYSLTLVEPATFRILINSKVIFSGILLQVLCGILLSARQWVGLVLLFIACGVEQLGSFQMDTGILALMLISFQAFCSSMAGVYFQLLLKRQGAQQKTTEEPSLWEKNFFLYCWSCIFNLGFLALKQPTILQPSVFMSTFNQYTLPIVAMSVCGGLSTSLILRYMDVIIKEYANFIEMCLVVWGANYLFGNPIQASLLLSIVLVTISLYLYNVPHTSPTPVAPVTKSEYTAVQLEEPSDDTNSVEMSGMNEDLHRRERERERAASSGSGTEKH